jgi:hypothetical protein
MSIPLNCRGTASYGSIPRYARALSPGAGLLTGDPEIFDSGDPTWPVVDLRRRRDRGP